MPIRGCWRRTVPRSSLPRLIYYSRLLSIYLNLSTGTAQKVNIPNPWTVRLTDFIAEMEAPGDTPETDERCRSIERGGRLVGVMPSTFAVTLQMPRGNIETIYPRALVLAGIRTFIDRKNYRSAFLACRSQMVDMNILHDYAPEQFMENIPLFIDQVKRIDFVDDFLSRLRYVITTPS